MSGTNTHGYAGVETNIAHKIVLVRPGALTPSELAAMRTTVDSVAGREALERVVELAAQATHALPEGHPLLDVATLGVEPWDVELLEEIAWLIQQSHRSGFGVDELLRRILR